MVISNPSDLSILVDKLLPDKFIGTTYEKLVKNFLKNLNPQHQFVNNFMNQFDVDYIETIYGDEELTNYTGQYLDILTDIMNIEYPNTIKNGQFNSSTLGEFWQYSVDPIESGNFTFDNIEEYAHYFHNSIESVYNELFQEGVIGGDKLKFEIQFDIEELIGGAFDKIEVYAGSEEPSYTLNTNGRHSFRIDFNTTTRRTDGRSGQLIFRSNATYKIKNVQVSEFERIDTEDLAILASELVRNKGKIEAYTLLFDLLNNLGSQGNLDNYIRVDEFEQFEKFIKPKVDITEVSVDINSNIKYNEEDELGDIYTFGAGAYYKDSTFFKSYSTEFNGDLVQPFIYRVDATFDEQVFKEYIMPIVHPTGWEIIYNIYSLVELIDKFPSTVEEYLNYREVALPLDTFLTDLHTGNPISDPDRIFTFEDIDYVSMFEIEADIVTEPSVIEYYIMNYDLESDVVETDDVESTWAVEYTPDETDLMDINLDEQIVSVEETPDHFDDIPTNEIEIFNCDYNLYHDEDIITTLGEYTPWTFFNPLEEDEVLTYEESIEYIETSEEKFDDVYVDLTVDSVFSETTTHYFDESTDAMVFGDTETQSYDDYIDINTIHMVRYIRDYSNGSTSNNNDHWVEIQAIDMSDTNVALGILPTTDADSSTDLDKITDGVVDSSQYSTLSNVEIVFVEIDLGETKELKYLHIHHYWLDNRTYLDTKTEVSTDGVNWVTVFDSSIDGLYVETENGRKTYINM